MEETVEVEETVEEEVENTTNPLTYVVTTLVVTGVAYVAVRFWQNHRRKNRLAVVETIATSDEKKKSE